MVKFWLTLHLNISLDYHWYETYIKYLNHHAWYLFQGAKKVKAQGMGVHTPEEVSQFGCADLKVLSDMLADKPFFFGDEPTTVNKISIYLY